MPHPDHLLRQLDARQLAELYAFLSLEPVDEGLNVLAAQWFSLYANSLSEDNKTTPMDWLRDFAHEARNEDTQARNDALKSLIERLANGHSSPTRG